MKLSTSACAALLCTLVCSTLANAAPPKKKTGTASTASAAGAANASAAASASHFEQWKQVNDFITEMVSKHGFSRDELTTLFSQVKLIESARQLVKPAPPGKPKNWKAYRARFIEPRRIDAGLAFWNQYSAALERAQQKYGVPPEIIVGLIGVETIFGQLTGKYRVADTLTTLAFAYPETANQAARQQFFRGELESLLLIARDSHLDPLQFRGSYAGAIGWCQFMPSSIRQYAVDFDGDGVINLNDSPVDAIGSVAHYLAEHGWKRNLPIAAPATLNSNPPSPQLQEFIGQGLRAGYSLSQLKVAVSSADTNLPDQILYGLADLQNGDEPDEYWLVTDNFFAITHYNRSYFYAMSVYELGRVIATARNN